MKMKKIGFTIGKFAPFHKGHEYLIQTGIKEMDEFYVVVYDTNLVEISIEKRAELIYFMHIIHHQKQGQMWKVWISK